MSQTKNFLEIFNKFMKNPKLAGTYASSIYHGFELLDNNPPPNVQPNANRVILGLKVDKEILNIFGSAHGGALSTILDTSTTLAILKADKKTRKSVSAQLNVNFMNPAMLDEYLIIQADCLRVGKTMAFTEAKVFTQNPYKLIISGSHIKALLDEPFI